ncbi:stressosome-associated protein Prli42 [Paenibacillus physcomitrellae]|nr:stressosome-associated protein Prli42 [Paenibacillus physcomitrellae]
MPKKTMKIVVYVMLIAMVGSALMALIEPFIFE